MRTRKIEYEKIDSKKAKMKKMNKKIHIRLYDCEKKKYREWSEKIRV